MILECCESDEQRSFYIRLAAAQNLSKLALMKAIEENTFDALSNEESPAESTEPGIAAVSDISSNTSVDTTAIVETACAPFVPACEPLRQGGDMPSSIDRLSVAAPEGRAVHRGAKHKTNDGPPLLGVLNQPPPYPPPPRLKTDKMKSPQNFPHGMRPRMENLRELYICAIKQNAPTKLTRVALCQNNLCASF